MPAALDRLRSLRERERAFRERQRERVAASRRRRPLPLGELPGYDDEQLTHDLLTDILPRAHPDPALDAVTAGGGGRRPRGAPSARPAGH
jgi:hypothetical protein